jgi:hypothetical protein
MQIDRCGQNIAAALGRRTGVVPRLRIDAADASIKAVFADEASPAIV